MGLKRLLLLGTLVFGAIGAQAAPIDATDFYAVIDGAINGWQENAKAHGARLESLSRYDSDSSYGTATRAGAAWYVVIDGGYARNPAMTRDGLALVACHELGHHFGGAPFMPTSDYWSSNEGQADYFATQDCLPKLWENEPFENAKSRETASDDARHKCGQAWPTVDRQNLCLRIVAAGLSFSAAIAIDEKRPAPRVETPDTKTVLRMEWDHSDPQCRLDTFISGALRAERPRCWFAPR